MSGVPNQGHFYCSAAFDGSAWLLLERSCKAKGIDGHFCYRCPSKAKAYRLRSILNNLYKCDRLSALARFRFFADSPDLEDFGSYDMVYYYALGLWDDSQIMSAPIVNNGV